MGNKLILGIVSLLCLSGCAGSEQHTPGQIDHETRSSTQSQRVDDSSSLPTATLDTRPPKVNADAASQRLSECMSKMTDTSKMHELSQQCYMSYEHHLPLMYKMRSVGDIMILSANVVADDQRVRFEIASSGSPLGTIEAYYLEELKQLKIVNTSGTELLDVLGSQTVYNEAKAAVR